MSTGPLNPAVILRRVNVNDLSRMPDNFQIRIGTREGHRRAAIQADRAGRSVAGRVDDR